MDVQEVTVRPITLTDLPAVKSVLTDAAFSNLTAACQTGISKVSFQGGTLLLAALVCVYTQSVLALCLTVVACLVTLFLFNVAATSFYLFGPPLWDIRDAKQQYLTDPETCFWVAEVKGQLHEEVEVAGTIAIVKKKNTQNKEKVAWLRRMAVKKKFRRMGIAKRLVETTIDFCKSLDYKRIELITTEIHQPARNLYTQMGFECIAFKPYKYYGGLARIWTYEFILHLDRQISNSED